MEHPEERGIDSLPCRLDRVKDRHAVGRGPVLAFAGSRRAGAVIRDVDKGILMPASSRSTKPNAGTPAPASAPATPAVDIDPTSPGNQEILQRIAEEGAGAGSATPTLDAAAPAHGKHGRVGLNPAGLGVTLGDWNIGFKPKLSTDDTYDNSQNEEKQLRKEQEEVSERQDPRPR